LPLFQDRGDEEEGIPAEESCFIDLIGVDDKVFAQERKVDGLFNRRQISSLALEELLIRKDGDSLGTVLLVDSSYLERIEILPDPPLGWGAPLTSAMMAQGALLMAFLNARVGGRSMTASCNRARGVLFFNEAISSRFAVTI